MKKIDDRIMKIGKDKLNRGGYPFNVMGSLPDRNCVFDSFHGTVGFDIYPFSVTTRISASNQIFLKIYEEDGD